MHVTLTLYYIFTYLNKIYLDLYMSIFLERIVLPFHVKSCRPHCDLSLNKK